LREADFEPLYAQVYQLNLSIGAEGAAYIIKNAENTILAWQTYVWETRLPTTQLHKRLQGLVRQDALLQHRYATTKVLISVGHTVLLPTEWFDPAEAQAQFTLVTGEDLQDQSIHHDDVPFFQLKSLYAIPNSLQNAIKTCYPQAHILHANSNAMQAIHQICNEHHQICMYALVRSGSLTIAVADTQKLWLLNTYSYQTTKDFLYFILLAYQQLNLNTERTPLVLAGELIQDSDIYRVLRAYVKHIDWAKPPQNAYFGALAKTAIKPHFLNDLLF
jgi:hypothetical protein